MMVRTAPEVAGEPAPASLGASCEAEQQKASFEEIAALHPQFAKLLQFQLPQVLPLFVQQLHPFLHPFGLFRRLALMGFALRQAHDPILQSVSPLVYSR